MIRKNQGFTLVELAIVIVIIGLLVGGVLQGQELIRQAKVRAQIKQLSNVEAQHYTFQAKYNCLPGDCARATIFFGTTDKNGNVIRNGDGDGLLRSIIGPGAPFPAADCLSGVYLDSELPQYWLHLNNAGLGNYVTDGVGNSVNSGYPSIAAGNTGIIVSCLDYPNSAWPIINENLRKGSTISIGVLWNSSRIIYMTGMAQWNAAYGLDQLGTQADLVALIDRKTDDGFPNTGSFGIIAGPPSGCLTGSNNYPNDECRITAGKKLN